MLTKLKQAKNPDENLDLPVDCKNMMKKIFQTKILRLLSNVCEKPKRNSRVYKEIRLPPVG
jgi:hypothetical protein